MDAISSMSLFAERYRNYARVAATIFAILFMVMLFWKFFTYPDPPPGQDGTLISFGEPNVGQNSERAADTAPVIEEVEPEPVEEEEPEVEPEVEPEPVVEKPKVDPKKAAEAAAQKKLLAAEASKERAIKEKKRREEAKKKAAEDAKEKAEQAKKDAERRAEAEKKRRADEAKRKAKAEAARKAKAKADAEAARAAKQKADEDKMGGLFGKPGGNGSGNGGAPGNQGDPNGDPNSSALEGLGTGRVGGGLSNRGGKGPKLSDRSQKNGKVLVKVCVDSKGKVISASPTQGGSTIWDASLNRKIKANAMKWSFAGGELDKQCGTITYTFKLQ